MLRYKGIDIFSIATRSVSEVLHVTLGGSLEPLGLSGFFLQNIWKMEVGWNKNRGVRKMNHVCPHTANLVECVSKKLWSGGQQVGVIHNYYLLVSHLLFLFFHWSHNCMCFVVEVHVNQFCCGMNYMSSNGVIKYIKFGTALLLKIHSEC